jgi:hypothetical protein
VSMYCTLDDVKMRMTGDAPAMSADWDVTITDAIGMASDLIDAEVRQLRCQAEGWTFLPGTPTTRRYTGRDGGASLLLIDDAVAVSSAALLDDSGNLIQTLTAGVDYLPSPINSLPITGLRRLHGLWPCNYGGVQVALTPGYGLVVPPNVVNAAIAEVIRAIKGGQAGEDDRLGVTPYGSVVTSKALLQSTVRMLSRYRYGGAILRGGVLQ